MEAPHFYDLPIRSQRRRSSVDDPPKELQCEQRLTCYCLPLVTTASLHGSKDALSILDNISTPASILFDPKYTSRQRPSAVPPFRTFPPSPSVERINLPYSLPSTISLQLLDTEEPTAEMDKRHPSSFQQLEKLGEGTYATVSRPPPSIWTSLTSVGL
jgi:hypothetical protein